MSIERGDYSIEYEMTGSGAEQTAFAFEFPIKEASQILCFDITPQGNEDKTDLVTPIAAGYFHVSAAPAGYGEGGNVNLVVPLATGHILRIVRKTPATQKKRFSNQDRIRPEEIEDALDRITMWEQENNPEELRGLISKETAARVGADNLLAEWIGDEETDRVAADKALEKKIQELADSGLNAAALDDLKRQVAALESELSKKMPVAPNDGKDYTGSGSTWKEYVPGTSTPPVDPPSGAGDPFELNVDGRIIATARAAYLPNSIFNIRPGRVSVSQAAKAGDSDSVFIVGEDGRRVFPKN